MYRNFLLPILKKKQYSRYAIIYSNVFTFVVYRFNAILAVVFNSRQFDI